MSASQARTTPAAHRALALIAAAAILAACSGRTVTVSVPAITIPADSTAGTVCYAKGEAAAPIAIRSATYRAEAIFERTGGLIDTSDSVDVRVYGRSTAPISSCVSTGSGEVELGGPYTLVIDEPQLVVVGEGAAGAALAALVNGGDYWIGVALDAGFSIGGQRSITFAPGSVTVTF